MFRTAICAAALLGVAACATAGDSSVMLTRLDPIVVKKPDPFPYEAGIQVGDVSGLDSTVRFMGNEILSREEFIQALKVTLQGEGMLSGDPANTAYRLETTMVKVDTPYKIALNHSGYATFRYRLVRTADGAVLFDEEINTDATLTFDDERDGQKRLISAGRVAIRRNIRKAVALMIEHSGKATSGEAVEASQTPGG